jgi:hypothetical protein
MAANLRGTVLGSKGDVAGAAPPGTAVLWTGLLAGPLAWAADLMVRYGLVQWSCGTQQTIVIKLISLMTFLVVVGGGIVAARAYARIPSAAPTDGGRPIDRSRFMAIGGMLTAGLFAVVIIASAIPPWVLDACR